MGGPYCDVTPAEAKEVWDSLVKAGKPVNSHVVQKAFADVGRSVTARVIRNWKKNGWTRKDLPSNLAPTRSAQAVITIGAALPALDVTITQLFPEIMEAEIKPVVSPVAFIEGRYAELKTLSDEALLSESARSFDRMNISLSDFINQNAEWCVRNIPAELGSLLRGIAMSKAAVLSTYTQALTLRERTMKLLPDNDQQPPMKGAPEVLREDPLALELKAYERAARM